MELLTPRLRIRPHRLSDYEATVTLWQDEAVYRHILPGPAAREDQWHKLLRFAGHWAWLGYGMFVAEDWASGRFLGEVGVADFHRGLGPEFDGVPEAAWVMGPAAQGQGLAREAMAAVLAWRDAQLPGERTVCIIAPANLPSIRLGEALGFRAFDERIYRDKPVRLFERVRAG